MRRLVLVFLMLLLPLQWSWAAAASVCAHESNTAHFGHHEHKHEGQAEKKSDAPAGIAHADCHVCHGVGSGVLAAIAADGPAWGNSALVDHYSRAVPEPPIESLLRPPLKSLVA